MARPAARQGRAVPKGLRGKQMWIKRPFDLASQHLSPTRGEASAWVRIRPGWCGTEEVTRGRLIAVPTVGTEGDASKQTPCGREGKDPSTRLGIARDDSCEGRCGFARGRRWRKGRCAGLSRTPAPTTGAASSDLLLPWLGVASCAKQTSFLHSFLFPGVRCVGFLSGSRAVFP